MTNQTLGHHVQQTSGPREYLTLAFSPLSAPLRSRWRNNGLSADFLGDYVTTFLPTNGTTDAESRQKEIRHAVAYIANELLENSMKFHEREVDIPIDIHLELTSDSITVSASNGISGAQAEDYKAFVENILGANAGEVLVKQLEESATDSTSNKSCLGLLTMINDYHALLGWHFERHPAYPDSMTVTTSAVLPLDNVSGVSA